jgi:hypothetical protein
MTLFGLAPALRVPLKAEPILKKGDVLQVKFTGEVPSKVFFGGARQGGKSEALRKLHATLSEAQVRNWDSAPGLASIGDPFARKHGMDIVSLPFPFQTRFVPVYRDADFVNAVAVYDSVMDKKMSLAEYAQMRMTS